MNRKKASKLALALGLALIVVAALLWSGEWLRVYTLFFDFPNY